MNGKKYNYVYILTNKITGKQYVGDRSCNCLPEEDSYLGSGRPVLLNAKEKYGLENFEKEILELFETKKEAFNAQEKYIKKFNTVIPNGYNMDPYGGMGVLDSPLPENIRKKISNGNKGRVSPNRGKKLSQKHKENLAKSGRNRIQTEETKKKISESLKGLRKGVKLSDEAKKNMSIAKTGLKLSKKQLEARKHIKKKECPYCGNEYIPQHYNRSHGEKCKLKNNKNA